MGWFSKSDDDEVDATFRQIRASELATKASSFSTLGRHDEAITLLREAIALAPTPARRRFNSLLAHELRLSGKPEDAAHVLAQVLADTPVENSAIRVQCYAELGNWARDDGNISAAINLFEKALAEPRDETITQTHWDLLRAPIWLWLGWLRFDAGQLGAARDCARERLATKTECLEGSRLFGLAVGLLYSNHWRDDPESFRDAVDAQNCLARVVAARPKDYCCVAMLGVVCYHLCNTAYFARLPDEAEKLTRRGHTCGAILADARLQSAEAAEALNTYGTYSATAITIRLRLKGISGEAHFSLNPDGSPGFVVQRRSE